MYAVLVACGLSYPDWLEQLSKIAYTHFKTPDPYRECEQMIHPK